MLKGDFAPRSCSGQAVPIFHKPQPFQLLNSNDSLFFSHLPPPSPCARGEIRHQQQSILCSLAFSTPKDIYRDRYIDIYTVNWDINLFPSYRFYTYLYSHTLTHLRLHTNGKGINIKEHISGKTSTKWYFKEENYSWIKRNKSLLKREAILMLFGGQLGTAFIWRFWSGRAYISVFHLT